MRCNEVCMSRDKSVGDVEEFIFFEEGLKYFLYRLIGCNSLDGSDV